MCDGITCMKYNEEEVKEMKVENCWDLHRYVERLNVCVQHAKLELTLIGVTGLYRDADPVARSRVVEEVKKLTKLGIEFLREEENRVKQEKQEGERQKKEGEKKQAQKEQKEKIIQAGPYVQIICSSEKDDEEEEQKQAEVDKKQKELEEQKQKELDEKIKEFFKEPDDVKRKQEDTKREQQRAAEQEAKEHKKTVDELDKMYLQRLYKEAREVDKDGNPTKKAKQAQEEYSRQVSSMLK